MGPKLVLSLLTRSVLAAGLVLLPLGPVLGQGTTLASKGGVLPTGDAFAPQISSDGRYVGFFMYDSFTDSQTFFRDRVVGDIEVISVDSSGLQGDSYSYSPRMTPDARFAAFSSYATNLVIGDTNGPYPAGHDVFVRDRLTGTTERVSVGSMGEEGNDSSWSPAISSDGRCVAFTCYADNLIPADTNGFEDVLLRDRASGTTELVSVDSSGVQAAGESWCSSISGDGSYVVFQSLASNLVSGDSNAAWDVFVRERASGSTARVSVDSSGAEGNAASDGGALTPDGRFVAFRSSASNLVPGDTNGKRDLFLHDRWTGTTERVSVGWSGAQADDESWAPAVTPDGRYVAFQSRATNLVAGDTNGTWDVFVRDRLLDTTERVSLDATGAQASNESGIQGAAITPDGRCVAFDSRASLVPEDGDSLVDVYVRDRGPQLPVAYCTAGTTTHGCNASISATGSASASAGSGFVVTVDAVEGNKQGIVFWGTTPAALPWGAGTSWLCVSAPTRRTGVQSSGGAAGACDGALTLDFNAWMAANPTKAPVAGTTVYLQGWFRDPPSPQTSSLSNGLCITVGP